MGEKNKKPERFLELEGLRGIAAVAVAAYHSLLGFFTFAFLGVLAGSPPLQHSRFESMLLGNPFAVFLSGTFAVSIFFVLSGFVLSIGFFQTGREDIVKSLAARRYLRLMLPALASTLLCVIIMSIGLSRVDQAEAVTGSSWLASMWNPPYGVLDAIRSASVGIFLEGHSAYNNVLWTMTTEFIGSFLVFVTLLVAGKSKYRWIVYVLLFVLTAGTWYMAFVAGMLLADVYSHRPIESYSHHIVITVLLTAVAVYFGGYPHNAPTGQYYEWLPLSLQTASYVLGASAAVSIALWSKTSRKVLASKPLSRLGRYTFSLYLVHIPIVYSFSYWVFLKLYGYFGYTQSALLALVASIPVIALATYLFEKFVDAPSISLAARFGQVFLGQRKLTLPQVRPIESSKLFLKRYFVGVAIPHSSVTGEEKEATT